MFRRHGRLFSAFCTDRGLQAVWPQFWDNLEEAKLQGWETEEGLQGTDGGRGLTAKGQCAGVWGLELLCTTLLWQMHDHVTESRVNFTRNK